MRRWGSQGPIGSHRESLPMDVSCLTDDVESGSLDHVPFVGAGTRSHM